MVVVVVDQRPATSAFFGAATVAGARSDAERLLAAPKAIRDELLEALLLNHRLACLEPECTTCATLDCPVYDALHYDVEGCPSCVYGGSDNDDEAEEARRPPPKPPRRRRRFV